MSSCIYLLNALFFDCIDLMSWSCSLSWYLNSFCLSISLGMALYWSCRGHIVLNFQCTAAITLPNGSKELACSASMLNIIACKK